MIDVSRKTSTLRTATAEATLRLAPLTLEAIRTGDVPKGDPFEVARVAGVQAAKNTSQIIPYCHPLPVEFVGVELPSLQDDGHRRHGDGEGDSQDRRGNGSAHRRPVAALTLYDMLKMLDEAWRSPA